jgi:enoyl-CoA hydratase/carnithine racemase
MAYKEILFDIENAVATVALNRPDKLNAWTATMEEEVRDAMTAAGADPAVRVIVLTGAGRGFCAGADMTMLQSIGSKPGARRETSLGFDMDRRADWQARYSYFPAIPKPVIGAINGPAAGLGLIMALYCDWRYASDAAVFTTSFSRRGLIAEHGISWLLPRLVGQAQALDLLLSARKFDAAEALRIGLVNGVFPMASFADRVKDIARDLAENVSPRSTQVMKRQLWETPFQTMAEAMQDANREMRASFKSLDFKEGVAHFVEKRKARFTGE